MTLSGLFHILLLSLGIASTHAEVSCTSDVFCQELYDNNNTICLPDSQVCSNPLQHGCLRGRLGDDLVRELFSGIDEWVPRVCNSDDDPEATILSGDTICKVSDFPTFSEIRIHHAQWDTGLVMAWIYQILLTEVVKVPATVGLTSNTTAAASFYATIPTLERSAQAYPYDALEKAFQVENCSATSDPCADVLPDVNPGQSREPDYISVSERGIIEPVDGNGVLGRTGLHVPTRTLGEYPSFGVWQGLAGEDKRELLAEAFKRPTTWRDYCDFISNSTCVEADDYATRYPNSEEEVLYFDEENFRGFFRDTEKNDCASNPQNCTGHVVAPPCDWSARLDAQLFWNGIVGLESDGDIGPTNSYDQAQMIQIWYAANATDSNVIMLWNQPDVLDADFFGTDYEFQLVLFPAPTTTCLNSIPSTDQKCSEDFADRVAGLEEAACGDDVYSVQRLIASSVQDQANDDMFNAVERSPAFEFLKDIQVSVMDIRFMVKAWKNSQYNDPDGMDLRYAVCDWVIENAERIREFVPPGHPRFIDSRSDYSTWYLVIAQIFGAGVAAVSLVCFCLCWNYRGTKTMVFAQPIFLQLILLGFCMISIGAVMYALEPNTPRCTAAAWLLSLGFTVELVPVLVKTSAFNRLIRSSKKQKRVNINRRMMLLKVIFIVTLVMVYLLTWTLVDTPTALESRRISPSDPNMVDSELRCASDSDVWRTLTFAWEAMLLFLAAYLAVQSRNVMKEVNESKTLAIMVYSHFLFVCLRGISSIFYVTETLPASRIATLFSFNYSLDAFCAMAIYIFPKLIEAFKNPEDYKTSMIAKRVASSRAPSLDTSHKSDSDLEDDEFTLLCCTANIGNAEPSLDSMEAWIPPGGVCSRLESLDKGGPLPDTSFDVIAIGMQEATWKDSTKNKDLRGDVISEEDILNALEEKNTAHLREMIQDILGESYSQMVDEQRGQMRLQIWARDRVADSITDIRITGANTGIGNVLANKGGIVTTLTYKKTRISFLSAHLAAHEGESHFKARCENIRSILREAKTFALSKKIDVVTASHHMFVMGDLNFRTKFGQEKKHEENVERALKMIEDKDYEGLYAFDELQAALDDQELLVGFKTLPCNFPPTFKVLRTDGFKYKDQRTPSYTDRILFKSFDGLSHNLTPLSYEPCPEFITSDHKPIRGAFNITPNAAGRSLRVKGEYHLVFTNMKCCNLPAGDSDGKSDPYLMFLWDSPNLQTESKSLFDQLRKLWMGQSWPRTEYISKTLDPDWGDEKMCLSLKDCRVGSEQMLFIAAIDYDAVGKDTCLGVLSMNLKDLLSMNFHQREKIVDFDEPFLWEGRLAGRVQFQAIVSRDS